VFTRVNASQASKSPEAIEALIWGCGVRLDK